MEARISSSQITLFPILRFDVIYRRSLSICLHHQFVWFFPHTSIVFPMAVWRHHGLGWPEERCNAHVLLSWVLVLPDALRLLRHSRLHSRTPVQCGLSPLPWLIFEQITGDSSQWRWTDLLTSLEHESVLQWFDVHVDYTASQIHEGFTIRFDVVIIVRVFLTSLPFSGSLSSPAVHKSPSTESK